MLNPNAPIPLYRQLADQIAAKIYTGEYSTGSRIPSEPKLAAAHHLGRPTIRQAIDLLVRRGLLTRRRGSGTYVCDPRQEVDLFSLDGTGASFAKTGEPVEIRILAPVTLHQITNQKKNPFNGKKAYTLSRLTLVKKRPVLIEELYLHAGLFEGIEAIDLKGRSLSAIADDIFYLRPTGGRQCFQIKYLSGTRADHLELALDMPVLAVDRWLNFPQTPNGVYARLWCRTDQFVYSQTIGGTGYA